MDADRQVEQAQQREEKAKAIIAAEMAAMERRRRWLEMFRLQGIAVPQNPDADEGILGAGHPVQFPVIGRRG